MDTNNKIPFQKIVVLQQLRLGQEHAAVHQSVHPVLVTVADTEAVYHTGRTCDCPSMHDRMGDAKSVQGAAGVLAVAIATAVATLLPPK